MKFLTITVLMPFFFEMAQADAPVAKEIFFGNQSVKSQQDNQSQQPEVRAKAKRRSPDGPSNSQNLPSEFLRRSHARLQSTNSAIVVPNANIRGTLESLSVGDQLDVLMTHSVIAFPDEETPVISVVQSGPLEGAKLIGTSRLERNSQRIFVDFKRIVVRGTIYSTKASAVTASGQPGFEGAYYSKEASLFAGDFVASMVAGYFDGLVPRNTNPLGQSVQDNSVNSAMKAGLASGAMSSAKRFQEKLQKIPEFSEIKGPLLAKVLILEPAIAAAGSPNSP